MNARPPRMLLWGACASILLVAGFALLVAVAGRLAAADAETTLRARQALAIYAGVVLVKGLLPQLVLTLGFYRLAAPRAGFESTRVRQALGVAVCALVAGILVAGALLPLDLPGLPRVAFRGVGNFVATVIEMAAGVTAASLLPRWLLPALRPAAAS